MQHIVLIRPRSVFGGHIDKPRSKNSCIEARDISSETGSVQDSLSPRYLESLRPRAKTVSCGLWQPIDRRLKLYVVIIDLIDRHRWELMTIAEDFEGTLAL